MRGRRLIAPPRGSHAVRPTSDRAREAIFSMIGEKVVGAKVLDLYCGTGALAIEALSRGAPNATLVDSDIALARRNADALKLGRRAYLVRSDALDYLRKAQERFDLVFCDPPYRLADRLEGDLDQLVSPRLEEGALVILESSAESPLGLSLPLVTEREYGEAAIRVYAAPES